MEFSKLGHSGLTVSKIAYGNWINHGGKVNEDTANDCVKAALDIGITTFDTADVYSDTIAEEVLGRSLKGIRRESIELFVQKYAIRPDLEKTIEVYHENIL